ncbi:gamma-glutamyltransferase [Bradyrhizobium erythrophlei]|jgi:gamma-glutamyltranspeptidase/glutathione hydrolase|uniref:Glutathione hydrolase proenzyme n=1 Tax=Bradyrhizobium erythrophlei TaxID=1437360 RepID=A0A1M5YRI6_9BRAD|nr:gamma-glutamyltransferase [Bradyrhizobium erythrophlei]SHI14686.1 gamma-glutamyltransferase 1 Threonine peptidase. MEROPS family T03 [Bradyrhizobium erythrophlei]
MISFAAERRWIAAGIVLVVAWCGPCAAQEQRRGFYTPPSADAIHAVVAEHGMVVAQEKIAARIGADVLRRGGNAVDAAVATGFAMAVTYPRAGNIGGGGFMVIHSREHAEDVAIDYRETAPAATTPGMFLGADGKPDIAKSRDSALSIGVPGTVAGLTLALEKYGSGKFTLAALLQPAIDLARDGFVLTDDGADTLPDWHRRLARWPASAKIFSRPDGTSLREGDRLVQTDLAATLSAIAEQGPRGFYEGPVPEKLVKAIGDAGGIMTSDDLKSYQAVIRAPVRGSYRGYDIVSMPQPSSGGVVLLETLNILEGFPMHEMKQGSAPSLHLLIEAMKRAYADRARYLGDPAFISAPVATLISKDYAAKQRAGIDPDHATPWTDALSATPPHEGSNTTHFSVVDSMGNAVSNTYTLNFSYGVGLVADGTGVLLNNELDDFTAAPGASNAFGLVGFEANLPGPGKRPLSSMAPTIVLKDNKPVLVTGSPGGSRIISTVLQVIVNVLDYSMNVAAAVDAPRLHHQWLPDEVRIERGFADDTIAELKAKGHHVVEPLGQTSANSIAVTDYGLLGAPDPRSRGAEAAGQ